MSNNGEKTTLKNMILMIVFGLSGWALIQIVKNQNDIASVKTQVKDVKEWMNKIDGKLDTLLDR